MQNGNSKRGSDGLLFRLWVFLAWRELGGDDSKRNFRIESTGYYQALGTT